MTLNDQRAIYQHFSLKLGDISRQLSFCGFAVAWLFNGNKEKVSTVLLSALIAFSLVMLIDILYYSYGTILHGSFSRKKELQGVALTEEITWSKYYNYPKIILLALKVLFLFLGYVFISYYFIRCYIASA